MKKLLLTIALVSFCFSANAQVKFGARAGLNFASMTGDDTVGLDGRTSLHFGITTEIEISDSFSLQPELTYSGQGYTADYEFDDFESGTVRGEITGRVNYLNLPVMAKFYVAESFSLEFGPQIGFLMSAEENDYDTTYGSETYDIKEDLKSTDFSLNFGAGYKLDSGLNFGLRYNMGLTDVSDNSLSEDGTTVDIKHGVLQVSVGYTF